jgi:integrase
MMSDERKHAVEVNGRTHLEMDEVEELLELARKTDERSWCILTLAFNHGLRVSECAGGAPAILILSCDAQGRKSHLKTKMRLVVVSACRFVMQPR